MSGAKLEGGIQAQMPQSELGSGALPAGWRTGIGAAAHSTFWRAADATLLASASAPLMAAGPSAPQGAESSWSNSNIDWLMLAAGAAAGAGWAAWFSCRADGREKAAELEKELTGVRAQQADYVDVFSALLQRVQALPSAEAAAVTKDMTAVMAAELEPQEMALLLGALTPGEIAVMVSSLGDQKGLTQKAAAAVTTLDEGLQSRVFVEMFKAGAGRSMLSIWPVSDVRGRDSMACKAREGIRELISSDPALMREAAQSPYTELRMAAVNAADKRRHAPVAAILMGDSDWQIRNAAFSKWLDGESSWAELRTGLESGGAAVQQKALSLITLKKAEPHRQEAVSLMPKLPPAIRTALYEILAPKLKPADLDFLVQGRHDAQMNWRIFEHPRVSPRTAACCVEGAMKKIKVVDVPGGSYYAETFDEYNSYREITIPEESHEEFLPGEMPRVMKVVGAWNGAAVGEFLAALGDPKLRSWIEKEYNPMTADQRAALLPQGTSGADGELDLAQAAELCSRLDPAHAVDVVVKRVDPSLLPRLLMALPREKALALAQTLPAEFVLKGMQAAYDKPASDPS